MMAIKEREGGCPGSGKGTKSENVSYENLEWLQIGKGLVDFGCPARKSVIAPMIACLTRAQLSLKDELTVLPGLFSLSS
jgi:adenylate kinase family enzyme